MTKPVIFGIPRKLFIALCLLGTGLLLSAVRHFQGTLPAQTVKPDSVAPVTVQVVRVIDGDTLEVMGATHSYRVRLWGIDAPEHDQPRGDYATAMLHELVYQQKSEGRICLTPKGEDKYGRTLAVVLVRAFFAADAVDAVPGKRPDTPSPAPCAMSANQIMVLSGAAWVYRWQGTPTDPALMPDEATARKQHRGLWQDNAPVEPWRWRESTQPLSVKEK